MRWRRVLARLALALFALAVGLLLAEKTLKLLGFEKKILRIETGAAADWRLFHVFQDEYFEFDPELIWRPKRGMSPFNRQGFRGPELPLEKPPGAFRIFAVGDSNTLGWGGEDGANWPGSLHRLLSSVDPSISVVNAGVYGYTSHQGIARLREVLPFSPDLVLISFGSNDGHQVGVVDRAYTAGSPAGRRVTRFLRRFRIGALMLNALDRGERSAARSTARVPLPEYRQNLAAMVDLVRHAGGVPVLLSRPSVGVIIDPLVWKNWADDYNVATLEVADSEATPFVDLFSVFKERDELFADECHFTAEGHQRAAELVAEALLPLLPPPPRRQPPSG